jgi:hypothetical protein
MGSGECVSSRLVNQFVILPVCDDMKDNICCLNGLSIWNKKRLQIRRLEGVPNLVRKERDSNPRTDKSVNGFRDRPIQPLWHLSEKGM